MITLTEQKHLGLIRAFCERNLEIASNRTPGKWSCPNERIQVFMSDCRPVAMCWGPAATAHGNAAFIAACAGSAEAGWKATIAAIDWLTEFSLVATKVDDRLHEIRRHFISSILAAWPLDLISTHHEHTN